MKTLLAFNAALAASPWLPLLIFLAEMGVVTLGTIRTIFVARGLRFLAPLLGFFEISIWLFAIGQIMQNLTSVPCYIAFAGGFTTGNFLGIYIEQKLALGTLVIRIITHKDGRELIDRLRLAGYGVTSVDARGATGRVQIIFTIIRRKDLDNVFAIIKQFDPKAFYAVEDLRSAREGVFPATRPHPNGVISRSLRLLRVGK